jgi:hypothetical protein
MLGMKIPEDPNNESSKWPAIILAVNRIAKVKGRMSKLIVSIITIKGDRIKGVFWGVKWVNKSFKKKYILYIIIPNHIEREKEKQNLICLEAVKI